MENMKRGKRKNRKHEGKKGKKIQGKLEVRPLPFNTKVFLD
jgi:hypothetical protein